MKQDKLNLVLLIGIMIAVMSPVGGAMILDENKENKIDAMVITFIPMGIGASVIMYCLFVKSDEEKMEKLK